MHTHTCARAHTHTHTHKREGEGGREKGVGRRGAMYIEGESMERERGRRLIRGIVGWRGE